MSLSAKHISKAYGGLDVLRSVSFQVSDSGTVSIVGPSGCGKTTFLNLAARLDQPDEGSIEIEPEARVGYVMQDPLLLPWRTLEENATLGLEVTARCRDDYQPLLRDYFSKFDLRDSAKIYPNAASGGMKQRVALIRTLLTMPSVLLLDEPFSALDFDVKLKIQRYLVDYQQKHATAIVLVTHDIEDAIALSDQVIVLSDKPATIKTVIQIAAVSPNRDPVAARKSPRFAEYFTRIWDEIKYLDNE